MYGRSPWVDQFPQSRVPAYPRQRGRIKMDVVIVGGGLTGCATAYAFSGAGLKVALLEAGRIGRGSTGSSAGWIGDDPGGSFVDLEQAVGLRRARHAWQAWHKAGLDLAALLRQGNVTCQLEPCTTLTVAMHADEIDRLTRERKARRAAGVDVPLVNAPTLASEVALTAASGVRTPKDATLDPYRATVGLAAAAIERGARIFEHSAARTISFDRKSADIETPEGAIHTTRIIMATGSPTALVKGLRRHFWFRSTYLALTAPIPAKIRQQLGARLAVVRDSANPPHLVRWVRWGDAERLLVMGADSETPPEPRREKTIIQRTGQLMYELSTLYPDISGIQPEYGWEAPYTRSGDGLPCIGPHRNYPFHLFAFGDASHGLAGAYLASRVLLRHHLDKLEPADEVFGFR